MDVGCCVHITVIPYTYIKVRNLLYCTNFWQRTLFSTIIAVEISNQHNKIIMFMNTVRYILHFRVLVKHLICINANTITMQYVFNFTPRGFPHSHFHSPFLEGGWHQSYSYYHETLKDEVQFLEIERIQDTRGHWLYGHSIPQHVPLLCMCSTSHEFHHLK